MFSQTEKGNSVLYIFYTPTRGTREKVNLEEFVATFDGPFRATTTMTWEMKIEWQRTIKHRIDIFKSQIFLLTDPFGGSANLQRVKITLRLRTRKKQSQPAQTEEKCFSIKIPFHDFSFVFLFF